MERNADVFFINLDRFMILRAKRNAALARDVGVSRQLVATWRQQGRLLSVKWEQSIADALGCSVEDLYSPITKPGPAMLPIAQWAKRENIPLSRAKALFETGILKGGIRGEMHLVPISARSPINSNHMIRSIKRPTWVTSFPVNLCLRMEAARVTVSQMASHFGIRYDAVRFWRIGRNNPKVQRLPEIADLLHCAVEDLTREPTPSQTADWISRYKDVSLDREAA